MQTGGDCNRNESESGDHKAALKQKKLRVKTLKRKSSNKDMNCKVEAGGSNDRVYDDTVLCSPTKASFNSLISRKKVRTLGKVAQQCDTIDPPVPRRLRSAINKRVRHVKKRRHLSAISAQISFVDRQTRVNEASLLTEEEEVADALLSLSQIPSTREFTVDKAADSMDITVSPTCHSEGGTKEGDRKSRLLNTADELSNQVACIARQTESDTLVIPVPGDTNLPKNLNPSLLENAQRKDLSLGAVANLSSQQNESSNNSLCCSAQKPLKGQLDDSKNYTQKREAWLVDSNKSDNLMHNYGKAKNDSAQEIIHRVQTPLPCTPDGYLVKPSSSKLAVQEKTVSEFSKVTASGNLDKLPVVNNGAVPKKTWKRSITHVYVSHLIQMHLNKEKAVASQCQVTPEERSHVHHTSRSANGFTSHKSKAQDETCYSVHLDVRLPVEPSTGICTMSAAAGGRQKMVSGVGGNFLNLPASSTALAAGAQHVPYLHPQIAPRSSSMAYPFPHLPPHSRANLAPAAALQQMQQYMCNQGYAPRPGLTAHSSSAVMKLQQLVPSHQQQQQQMWQFHIPQYQATRSDVAPPGAGGAGTTPWHNMASLRPMPMVPSPAAMPPTMELLCAPYQGRNRQPQQLRLI